MELNLLLKETTDASTKTTTPNLSRKKDRASRNGARSTMTSAGKAKKGDGKDVHHKDKNPRNNSKKNLAVVSKSRNRSSAMKKKSSRAKK